MATKHTPGPWRAYETEHTVDPKHNYWHIDSGHGFMNEEGTEGFGISGLLTPADAALIAAAPSLLEVLREVREALDSYADADHNGISFVPNEAMRAQLRISEVLRLLVPPKLLSIKEEQP